MDAEPFSIPEAELAEKLGVSREALTEIRTVLLDCEKDWGRKKSAVIYFRTGVTLACEQLGIEIPAGLLAAPDAAEKKDGAGAGEPAPASTDARTVFVKRAARLNPRMIFVTEKKDDLAEAAEIPVRVRQASLFVPGQEIRITPAGTDGLATLHGQQPRQRGRNRRRA